jgi:DNA polymerase III delta subunit
LNQAKECSIYITAGSNTYINDKINDILNNRDVELITFFGDEFDKEEYFSFIFTPSLFFDFKVAIIKNAEKYNNITEIIIESAKEKYNKKIICFPPESGKILNNLQGIKNLTLFREEKKTYRDHINEIRKRFEQINVNINYDDAREIYEMLGRNVELIQNEIEKVSLYCYNKTSPTIEEIFNIINTSQHNVAFKFIDAICNKNKRDVIRLYEQLKESHTNMNMLFYMLVKQIKDILLYKISPSFVTGQTFMIEKISKAAKLWSMVELKKIFEKFLNCDYYLKRSSIKAEHLIFDIINLL